MTLRPVIFGKHCLLERVSIGGMAEVYRAKPFNAPGFKRFLAVKRILPSLAVDDEFVSMFVDEAKIAVQLNHRSICQIYELGRLEGTFYIVMEYIPGKDLLALQNWFRKRKKIMSVAQAVHIAAQVCEGLDYAHRKVSDEGVRLKIIHRDVSPQNILVSYDGDVKVIDFGIARAATTSQVTQVGVLKGKFGYMSPEQVDGNALDHRSDIFALGTLLWEMLTARRLFYADTDFATLEKVRSAEIKPPSSRNKRVPREIDRIVLKALTRDPEERYQWASELAADLHAFLQSVRPAYASTRLSNWMVSNFRDELAAERHKVEEFADFVTVADVHQWYALNPDEGAMEVDDDIDDDEATRVFDPEASRGPGPPVGSRAARPDDEVLAENELEPLPTVVLHAEELGDGLPALDLDLEIEDEDLQITVDPVPDNDDWDYYGDLEPARALPRTRRREAVLVAMLLMLFVAIAALGWKLYDTRFAARASVVIAVMPADGVLVFLDGVQQEPTLPLRIDGIEPGTHRIQVRHPDYQPVDAPIIVAAGSVTEFTRALVPLSAGTASVSLELENHLAEVFVDGRIVGGQGGTRHFSVSAGEPHLVEVHVPGHFVETYDFELGPDAAFSRIVTLRPVEGSMTIGSSPAGDVYLDGEERGNTEDRLTISGLDPRGAYQLEIRPDSRSFRQYEQTIVFDTYYDLRIHPRLPRRGTGSQDEPVEFGLLTTGSANRWYRVFVDGRDTGLTTPIPPEAPLALKAGERRVSFVRATGRRDTTVTVKAGETIFVPIPGSGG